VAQTNSSNSQQDRRRNSQYFDGRRFCNPAGPAGRGLWHYLRWVASCRRKRWARCDTNGSCEIPSEVPSGSIAATFINHASFLIQINGFNLLTDPVYSDRVGPWNLGGPRRTRPPGVPFDQLPRIDCVLLSHNHYDHLDIATLRRLQQKSDPLFVTSLGNERFLRRKGFRMVAELDWWEAHAVRETLKVELTPAQHFSSRHCFDRDQTLWGGFSITSGDRRVYFVGDSGYGEHFKEIGARLAPVDLALIPIGAYEPRWFMQYAHVNPDEAVQIHLDVRPRLSVGMHFGTFQLTDEPLDEPPRKLREALQTREVPAENFIVPEFGQTIVLPPA
jgi:L-ascorbate metabolism protein UlaG (beta-lactamase superfamily)